MLVALISIRFFLVVFGDISGNSSHPKYFSCHEEKSLSHIPPTFPTIPYTHTFLFQFSLSPRQTLSYPFPLSPQLSQILCPQVPVSLTTPLGIQYSLLSVWVRLRVRCLHSSSRQIRLSPISLTFDSERD